MKVIAAQRKSPFEYHIDEFDWDAAHRFLYAAAGGNMGCLPSTFHVIGHRQIVDFWFIDWRPNNHLWGHDGWYYQSLDGKHHLWCMQDSSLLEERLKRRAKKNKNAVLIK